MIAEISVLSSFFLVFFGFLIGVLGSVMGVGGGVFIVPLLVLVFNLPIQNAIAVSLVSIVATSSAVASVNVEKGLANVRLGIFMETTMALGSLAGALFMTRLPSNVIMLFFSLFLFPVAVSMYLKSKNKFPSKTCEVSSSGKVFSGTFFDGHSKTNVTYAVQKMPLAMFFSFFAGALSGLLGLGGGIVQVPVMNLICNVPIKAAAATSNFMIGVSAAASAIIFYRKGFVISEVAVIVCFGVLLGSIFGMKFLSKTKSEKIQALFSFLIMLVAVRMLFKSL